MDKIQKLLLKISKKERVELLRIIRMIIASDKGLKIVKIKNSDFYRVRVKRFRIIFHKDKKEVIIDSVKLRDENTYKNL